MKFVTFTDTRGEKERQNRQIVSTDALHTLKFSSNIHCILYTVYGRLLFETLQAEITPLTL